MQPSYNPCRLLADALLHSSCKIKTHNNNRQAGDNIQATINSSLQRVIDVAATYVYGAVRQREQRERAFRRLEEKENFGDFPSKRFPNPYRGDRRSWTTATPLAAPSESIGQGGFRCSFPEHTLCSGMKYPADSEHTVYRSPREKVPTLLW